MAEPNRPTVVEATMIDVLDEAPAAGAKVWALQHGGCVVPVEVKSDFAQHYDAWYPYLKVPRKVKERQLARIRSAKTV